MKYALYLGCAIPIKYPGFEAATRLVCERLGIELVDLPFSCCPPPDEHEAGALRLMAWRSRPETSASRRKPVSTCLTLCAGCVNTLKEANLVLKQTDSKTPQGQQDPGRISIISFEGTIEVTHILDVLYQDSVVERMIRAQIRDIPLRVGCHYGCHYFRPPKAMYPDELSPAESYVPVKMDHLLSIIGVEPMEYSRKFLCCGSPSGANMDQEAGYAITNQKLSLIPEQNIQAFR